jgi:hypothetical protein
MEHVREKMRQVDRYGPFLAELWERETSKFRHGDFVEPTYPARRWFVLRNVFYDTPQLVRVNLSKEALPPVREEAFQWQDNVAFCNQGNFDVGPARRFNETQVRITDPRLVKESPGVYRPRADSILLREMPVEMNSLRTYTTEPQVIEALEAHTGVGAQGWTVLTRADLQPHAPIGQ